MRDWTNERAMLEGNHLAALGPETSREALAEIARLKGLLEAVKVTEFLGIVCESVNGKSWFDERDKALAGKKEQEKAARDKQDALDQEWAAGKKEAPNG